METMHENEIVVKHFSKAKPIVAMEVYLRHIQRQGKSVA